MNELMQERTHERTHECTHECMNDRMKGACIIASPNPQPFLVGRLLSSYTFYYTSIAILYY